MDKRTFIKLISCFLISISVIVMLQWMAVGPNQQKNHFIRVFPPHFFEAPKMLDLANPHLYFAGLNRNEIYFSDYRDPASMLTTRWDLLSKKEFRLSLPAEGTQRPSGWHLSIYSSFLFLNNFLTGTVFISDTAEIRPPFRQIISSHISTSAFIPCSPSCFAIRTYDDGVKENVLGKISSDTPFLSLFPHLLEKKSDNLFTNDGLLRYDPRSRRFVFVYFYRNRFISLDSNMNLLYAGQTLDTNHSAKIRVVSIPSQHFSTLASPGYRVNRTACLNSDWLFINSDLQADNEEKNIFENYAVIDAYALKDGRYHFSFYLPKKIGKITDMAILNNRLAVIQDHWLTVYPLNMDEIRIISNPG